MSGLQFQSFTNADFSTTDTGRIGDNKANDDVSTTGPKRNFFSFEYYQQFFDVDTDQVTKRILNSAVPTHNNFISDFVQPIPDLYGPFWICVTLVFSIGIFSNIAQYIENEGGSGDYGSDFRMVTSASSLISTYVLIVPSLLYALILYRKSEVQYSYFEIICAYGYSLAIFIPVSILWTFDVNWFRWALIFAAVSMSGTVLAKSFWPAFKNDSNKLISFGVIFGVMFLHFLLAICFKEYFFDAVHARTVVVDPKLEADATTKRELPTAVLNQTDAKLPKSDSQVKIEEPAIMDDTKKVNDHVDVRVDREGTASENKNLEKNEQLMRKPKEKNNEILTSSHTANDFSTA